MRSAGALVTAVAVAVAGAAGCGYQTPSPYTRARAAAEAFVESCARGYPERAVDVLTEPLQAAFIRAGSATEACARLLGSADVEAARVVGVELHGARAEATVRAPAGRPSRLELGFYEDEWRVDGPGARL